MLLGVVLLFAEGEGQNPNAPSPFLTQLVVPMLLMAVVFYFLMIRPQQKRDRQRREQLSKSKKNDKVITSAGIVGTIASIEEQGTEFVLKVEENTRLRMLKSSITTNVTQEEEAKATVEAQKTQKTS